MCSKASCGENVPNAVRGEVCLGGSAYLKPSEAKFLSRDQPGAVHARENFSRAINPGPFMREKISLA